MRDVAVVSFAQARNVRRENRRNEVEMLIPVVKEAVEKSGIPKSEIGFTCSGSSDYLAGQSFSFVMAVDALGAWPPISESHVEMDGAWALYEAWLKIQCGEADSALVFCVGRSSPGSVRETLTLQMDPYTLMPLGADPVSLAALQARALLEKSAHTEREMAEVVARSRGAARTNEFAQLSGDFDVDELLARPYFVSPLRVHDCPPISDGAAAVVLAADDLARKVCKKPAWIRGIDHRIESHQPGLRDLTRSASTTLAAKKAGVDPASLDAAELHAPFSHQELILRDALGLSDAVAVNRSGGALAANSILVAGLTRIGEAANQISRGEARRALAHATSGPCLQQNLVCVLEGE
jgi:acetyl-CoA acetyltransferase